jgi:hypothetical protein
VEISVKIRLRQAFPEKAVYSEGWSFFAFFCIILQLVPFDLQEES